MHNFGPNFQLFFQGFLVHLLTFIIISLLLQAFLKNHVKKAGCFKYFWIFCSIFTLSIIFFYLFEKKFKKYFQF